MNLKRAQGLARKLGGRILERGEQNFEISLGVTRLDADGLPHNGTFWAQTPKEALALLCIETAKAAKTLSDKAKQIYVDEDLLL
jgi:hypothetical protein